MKTEWMNSIAIHFAEPPNPGQSFTKICSLHFQSNEIKSINGKKKLIKNAVPTIFDGENNGMDTESLQPDKVENDIDIIELPIYYQEM